MSEVGTAQRDNAVPEVSFFSDTYTVSAGLQLTITHGLPRTPRHVWLQLKCVTAELGYAAGDIAELPSFANSSSSIGTTAVANGTQIKVCLASATTPAIVNFSTGAVTAITAANWLLVVNAEV